MNMHGNPLTGSHRLGATITDDKIERLAAKAFGEQHPPSAELAMRSALAGQNGKALLIPKQEVTEAVAWLRSQVKQGHLETTEAVPLGKVLELIEAAFGPIEK